MAVEIDERMKVEQTLAELVRLDSVSARSNVEVISYLASRAEGAVKLQNARKETYPSHSFHLVLLDSDSLTHYRVDKAGYVKFMVKYLVNRS